MMGLFLPLLQKEQPIEKNHAIIECRSSLLTRNSAENGNDTENMVCSAIGDVVALNLFCKPLLFLSGKKKLCESIEA